MKRIVVNLRPDARSRDVEALMGVLRQLPAVASARLVLVEDPPEQQRDPGDLTITLRSRAYVKLRELGELLAGVSDQQAALVQALLDSNNVFESSAELYAYLAGYDPIWEGRQSNVRSVYSRVRAKLDGSHHELLGGGRYGFAFHLQAGS